MMQRNRFYLAAATLALAFSAGCSAPAATGGTESATLPAAPAVSVPAPTAEPTAMPAPAVRSIAAGWGFTLARMDSGAVKCWGAGPVCAGRAENNSAPADVPGLSGIRAVAAGGGHACALTAEGGVKCWGLNNFGQLGNDTRENSGVPVDAVGLSGGVAAITAGGSHTCALLQSGGVKCWGQNDFGQLGDGTQNLSRIPADAVGLGAGVRSLSAGGTHTCAVLDGGGVKCWGFNGNGQLGNPETSGAGRYMPIPSDVQGLSEAAVEVAAGYAVTCVRTEAGGVKCWGQRGNGQLGDGLPPEGEKELSFAPVDVLGLGGGVATIAVGMGTACAVQNAGSLSCWGVLLGAADPAAPGVVFAPVPVNGIAGGIVAVTIGESHACALGASGAVWCWGKNAVGQLGDGTTNDSPVPVEVGGLT